MNSPRLWILILVGVAFLAGAGTGFVLAERSRQETLPTTPFAGFERAFVQEFRLDPERQRLLAGLLDHYNRETRAIQDRYAAEYHNLMEDELRLAGLEYRGLIRDQLLPEEQRPKFDRLMASYLETL